VFARTSAGHHLTPVLTAALAATDWRTREKHLAQAYETVADLHNQLELTDRVAPATRPERFTEALIARISDPAIKELPTAGSVDQFVDGTEVLTRPQVARAVYEEMRKPRPDCS